MEIVPSAMCADVLGESPIWSVGERRLYWLDIARKRMQWLEPSSGRLGFWELDCRASAIAFRSCGGFLLGTERGFATFEPATGKIEIVHNPEPERHWNRSNDGHADANGRFWLGTMDDSEEQRTGAVYRLDPDWRCTRVLDGMGIPNSLVCTPDAQLLYVADSKGRELFACELDPKTGAILTQRAFANTAGTAMTPDGSALDSDGFLWNAQWGGWRVVRYAPDGTIDRIVELPVEQPTSCAFGGDDLATLFITSARAGLSEPALEKQPLAGSVLSCRPGVTGSPAPAFGG